MTFLGNGDNPKGPKEDKQQGSAARPADHPMSAITDAYNAGHDAMAFEDAMRAIAVQYKDTTGERAEVDARTAEGLDGVIVHAPKFHNG